MWAVGRGGAEGEGVDAAFLVSCSFLPALALREQLHSWSSVSWVLQTPMVLFRKKKVVTINFMFISY